MSVAGIVPLVRYLVLEFPPSLLVRGSFADCLLTPTSVDIALVPQLVTALG